MSDFGRAFLEVIGLEGGYVNDPDDAGRETKYGISKRAYPDVDIKNLTLEEAKNIYWRDYWNPLMLALVKDNDVATEIFEQGINMGRSQAALHVQKALGMIGLEVAVDGMIGVQTIRNVNVALETGKKTLLLKALNGFQFLRYVEIIKDNPSQQKFFVGWLKRVTV